MSRRALGFTLLELLIALAIFALLATLAFGGLNAVTRQTESLRLRSDALQAQQRALRTLRRDLESAQPTSARGVYGDVQAALIGGALQLEFTRLGRQHSAQGSFQKPERVRYLRVDDELRRTRFDAVDLAPTTTSTITTLLDDLTAFNLRYLDAAGNSSSEWPTRRRRDERPDELPAAVVISLAQAGLPRVELTVLLSTAAEAPPQSLVPPPPTPGRP